MSFFMELRNIHNQNTLFHQWTQLSFGNRPLAPKALPQDSFKKAEEDDDTSSKNKKRFATPYSPKSRTRHSPASSVSGTTTTAGNVSIPALFGIATFATGVIGGAVLINKRLQTLQASRLQPEKVRRFKTLAARHFEVSTTESLLQTESTPKSSKTANDGNSWFSKLWNAITTLFAKSGKSTASAKNSAQSGNSIPPTPKSSKTANDGNSWFSKLWNAITTLFAKSGKSTAPAKKPTKSSKSSAPKKPTAKPGSAAPSTFFKYIQTLFTKSGKSTSTAKKPTKSSKSSAPKKPTTKPGSAAPSTLSIMCQAIVRWGKGICDKVNNPATWQVRGRSIKDWFTSDGDLSGDEWVEVPSGSTPSVESYSDEEEHRSVGNRFNEPYGEIPSGSTSPVYPLSFAGAVGQRGDLLWGLVELRLLVSQRYFLHGIEVPQDLNDNIDALYSSLYSLELTEESYETAISNELKTAQHTFVELKDKVDRLKSSCSGAPDFEEELNSTYPLVQHGFDDFRGVRRARTDSWDSEEYSDLMDD